MKNKMMLLALGLLAFASAALPAAASAGEPVIDAKAFPLKFTSSGTHAELRAASEPTITCTASTGSGSYASSTTGTISLTFTGCKTPNVFNAECHSTGQGNGTIVVASSVFHNIYVTDNKTTPGVLITAPSGGVFTTMTCATFFTTTIAGNGIIGHLESPKCGATSSTGVLNFTATEATQTFRQITATGTEYSLTAQTSGGTAVKAAEIAKGSISFPEAVTLTCV
jgi:hypothetical protein